MNRGQTWNELDAAPWLRSSHSLMATADRLRGLYDDRLSELGLNVTKAGIVARTARFGPHRQIALSQTLGVGRAAAGAAVVELEQAGLVSRTRDPEDGRVWLVDVTPAGRTTASRVEQIDSTIRSELRRDLTHEQSQELAAILGQLRSNIGSATARIP